jgi:hypothetical protein
MSVITAAAFYDDGRERVVYAEIESGSIAGEMEDTARITPTYI